MISYLSPPIVKVNIRNQCSDFKLTDRRGFNSDAEWNKYKYPDWEVDANNMMSVELKPSHPTFGGVLTYQLQSRRDKLGNQSESTCIRLLVAWKFEDYINPRMLIRLMKHDKQINWDRIKLEDYYQKYASQLSMYTGPIKDKWMLDDDTVLMTGLKLEFTHGYGALNITISEGIIDEHVKEPVWIDSKM
jgi:hypothetical protein